MVGIAFSAHHPFLQYELNRRKRQNPQYILYTGSHPQSIYKPSHNATGGVITSTSFVDSNGKLHEELIPAITFWSD